jgi:hypothetical protein
MMLELSSIPTPEMINPKLERVEINLGLHFKLVAFRRLNWQLPVNSPTQGKVACEPRTESFAAATKFYERVFSIDPSPPETYFNFYQYTLYIRHDTFSWYSEGAESIIDGLVCFSVHNDKELNHVKNLAVLLDPKGTVSVEELAEVGLCSRIPTRPRIPSPLHVSCFSRGGPGRGARTLGVLGGPFAGTDSHSWTWIVFRRFGSRDCSAAEG